MNDDYVSEEDDYVPEERAVDVCFQIQKLTTDRRYSLKRRIEALETILNYCDQALHIWTKDEQR